MNTIISHVQIPWLLPITTSLGLGLMLMMTQAIAQEHAPPDTFPPIEAIEYDALDELRGRDGDTSISVLSTQSVQATVNGSLIEAGTVNSGSVTFAEHSLDNFSGVGLFNVVTGNNNAVDAAIGVTFNLQ